MTDKPTFHPKPGRIDFARPTAVMPRATPPRGFDPAALGHWHGGPKGHKGRPMQLPRKSGNR